MAIQAIQTPISVMGSPDKFIWPYTQDGSYTVKTGYHVVYDGNQHYINRPSSSTILSSSFWNRLWNIRTAQKIKLFLWRMCNNALPVREALHRRKLLTSPLCPICSLEVETIEHTLLLCSWTRPVWFGSQLQLAPSPENVTRIDIWLNLQFEAINNQGPIKEQGWALLANTLWLIWKRRNKFTFQQEPLNPLLIINRASGMVKEFFDQAPPFHHVVNDSFRALKSWRPPLFNGLKCNVDAAFHNDSRMGAIAAIIRDKTGTMVTASAQKICCSSSLVAEALAIREGLKLANNCLCESIVLESDNLMIIEACRNKKIIGEIAIILEDIEALKNMFTTCGFIWTPREGNRVAHHIAQLAMGGTLGQDWVVKRPPSIVQLLKLDCNLQD